MKKKSFRLALSQNILFKDLLHYCYLFCISYIFSVLISKLFWDKNSGAAHTLTELASIIVAFTSFLIVWVRHSQHSIRNQIVAYGFLIVAIFDILHTYYFSALGFSPEDYIDLPIRFWILGRLTEAIILLTVTLNITKIKLGKFTALIISLFFSSSVSYLILYYPALFPTLRTVDGITNTKIALEYIIIGILLLTLWRLQVKLHKKDIFDYQYIALAILLFIPSELCFTLYTSQTSFSMVLGHTLKLLSYYYLFRGIIETEINYPYMKLEQSNKRLADILDAIPLAIHTYNEEMKIDFVNKKFEELLYCKKEDILGHTDEEVFKKIPKVDNTNESTLPYRLFNGEENTNNIIRTYITLNGQPLKALVNAHKIENGALVIIEDIKKMQEIYNLHLQTEFILNSLPSPVIITDVNGTMILCNNAFSDLLEMDSKDIIGLNSLNIGESFKFSLNDSIPAFSQGKLTENQYQGSFTTISGKKKEMILTPSIIRNIDGENIGSVCIIQDITDEKEKQQKLINQEKLALLGQMGAAIVHETRNFLATLIGYSQLIEQNTEDTKIKQYARQISTNTNEVNRIISDFLTLSKPRQAVMEEVSINDLIPSMRSTLETSSLMNGVNLNLCLDNFERYICCDEAMLRQVILNICKNAVEAMSETSNPILTIKTELNEEENQIIVRISDNGKGISKENLSQIGSAFFTTKPSGTGLGLNVCYQIIKEHNGKIQVESQYGEGTTFSITLPCVCEDSDDFENAI